MRIGMEKDAMKASPFLRILPPFLVGIALPGPAADFAWSAFGLLTMGAFLLLLLERLPVWSRLRLLEVPTVWILMLGCGMALSGLRNQALQSGGGYPTPETANGWLLEVESPPERTATGISFLARAWTQRQDGKWERAPGCLTYVTTGSGKSQLHIGDRLQIRKAPRALQGPSNPGGFDPRGYYVGKGVSLSTNLRESDYRKVGQCDLHQVSDRLMKLRESILDMIRTRIRHPEATGLAEALLIGYRVDLDQSVADIYTNTGVVHIIAISGMHIGMLYGILAWAFGQLPIPRRMEGMRILPPIAAVWVFTLLAGAGPSIVRSATQFTLIGIGKTLIGRRGDSINTLASSAFLLLAIRPEWLLDLGFQLSYAAVAGILLYHRRLCRLLPLENPVGCLLRDGIAMSLAAQTLTTPIILYRFGSFPTWFLFTNMVAVPLSTCILFTVLLMCLTAPWPGLSMPLGRLAEWGIRFMNGYVGRMDRMPGGHLEGIHLSASETALVFLAIAAASCWLIYGDNRWRTALAALVLLATALHALEWRKGSQQRAFVVWHLRDESLLLLVEGYNAYAYTKSGGGPPSPSMRKALRSAARAYRLRETPRPSRLPKGAVRIDWKGSILLVTGEDGTAAPGHGRADCVVLARSRGTDPGPWLRSVECSDWVADGSNSLWKIRRWQEAFAGLPLRFHSTSLSGAYVRTLR
ncbi:MAG: ComEC family competence protein [Chitinophagia bacterium]|nr:ComEC family competence protein [Chitinophagia bacterium]